MKIKMAKTAGFCFGVKRAVEKVYEQIENGKKIYTFGPIIHNEAVVADLEKKGVKVIEDVESLKKNKRRRRCYPLSRGFQRNIRHPYKTGIRVHRCNLSFCKKNTPDCGKGERSRKTDCYYRE